MPQPKTHKYNRNQRLTNAKAWIKNYTGKKLYHGYAKHYGVSKLCAVFELEMLGIKFPLTLKDSLIRAEEDKRKQREKFKRKQNLQTIDSDDYFAFIAGYTSGGAPYGVTWEEMEDFENNNQTEESTVLSDEEDLPF